MMTLTFSDLDCLDAALLMFRNTPETKNCSFLFVEGEDDEKFWSGRIIEQCCIVFVTLFTKNNQKKTGKIQLTKNIRSLNQSNINGYLGIVDDDFDFSLHLARENNICITETHDLETLLLILPTVFKKLLTEFGDSQLIAKFEKNNQSVQNYLLELALPFAQIEWIKQNKQSDLNLKDLHKNETILLRNKWLLDKSKLYSFVKTKGLDVNLPDSQQLLTKIANINPWLLCNGHVMTEILAIGFQNGILGNNKKATSENISSYIRAAIDKTELYQTQLCQSIFNWQNNHSPYQILI